jgi:hypothetical protein
MDYCLAGLPRYRHSVAGRARPGSSASAKGQDRLISKSTLPSRETDAVGHHNAPSADVGRVAGTNRRLLSLLRPSGSRHSCHRGLPLDPVIPWLGVPRPYLQSPGTDAPSLYQWSEPSELEVGERLLRRSRRMRLRSVECWLAGNPDYLTTSGYTASPSIEPCYSCSGAQRP